MTQYSLPKCCNEIHNTRVLLHGLAMAVRSDEGDSTLTLNPAIETIPPVKFVMRCYPKNVIALIALGICCGCQASREHLRDQSLQYVAHRAYQIADRPGASDTFPHDYRAGWEQAYYNVSIGQGSCPPTVPPECYWGTRFETARGRQRIEAWFRGYQCGAIAAECAQRDQLKVLPSGPPCERPRICEGQREGCGCVSPEIFYLPPVGDCVTLE